MSESLTLRRVDRFDEPAFSQLLARLLHEPDRTEVRRAVFGDENFAPPPSESRQVRIGAFDGDTLVGWSHAFLRPGGTLHVSNSAVEPSYRRQGVYTRLVAAVEAEARRLCCLRIESNHRAANNAVLIAKLKAGYTIVGTEYSLEMGLLVKMSKELVEKRAAAFEARSGVLELSARFFSRDIP